MDVIHEPGQAASEFPFGPYPKDKLTYKGDDMVEYETPAHAEGLGTQSRLRPNTSPIRGVAMLVGQDPDLLLLSVRLPGGDAGLAQGITRQLERDAKGQQQ